MTLTPLVSQSTQCGHRLEGSAASQATFAETTTKLSARRVSADRKQQGDGIARRTATAAAEAAACCYDCVARCCFYTMMQQCRLPVVSAYVLQTRPARRRPSPVDRLINSRRLLQFHYLEVGWWSRWLLLRKLTTVAALEVSTPRY